MCKKFIYLTGFKSRAIPNKTDFEPEGILDESHSVSFVFALDGDNQFINTQKTPTWVALIVWRLRASTPADFVDSAH